MSLPVDDVLPEVVEALRANRVAVLTAPPGAGKSTRAPLALLKAFSGEGEVWMLEPRRAAARAVASRLAHHLGERAGERVGYQVRFDVKRSKKTELMVVTEGILTRRLYGDPFLEGIGTIILDEFHERSVHVDLALAFLRELMDIRDDLRVLVMSATLDAEAIAEYLGGAPIIRSEGRLFPLHVHHMLDRPRDLRELPRAVEGGIRHLLSDPKDEGGDILVFLPGAPEIRRSISHLAATSLDSALEWVPLYGALPPKEQDRALEPGTRRRVILSTNIAETSLTIPGVRSVVDSGWMKEMSQDRQTGLDRLELRPISQDSATQRGGRAGRVGPGRVVRLWSDGEHRSLPKAGQPEICRVDLAPVLLQVLNFQPGDPKAFPYLTPPPEDAIDQALSLLRGLGALEKDGESLTPRGRRLGGLPVHPRLGAALARGKALGCLEEVALGAAILGEGDIFMRGRAPAAPTVESDLLWRMDLLETLASRRFRPEDAERYGIHGGHARRVWASRTQLLRVARGGINKEGGGGEGGVARALLAGFPDRVCKRRRRGEPAARMVGGRGVVLSRGSGVRDADVFLALEVEGGRRGAFANSPVRMASAIKEGWLGEDFPEDVTQRDRPRFEPETESVVGVREWVFQDLVLGEQRGVPVDALEGALVLADAAAPRFDALFSPDDESRRLIDRLRFAHAHIPEAGFPKLDQEALLAWLPELCFGLKNFEGVRRINWTHAIRQRVPYHLLELLDREVPERLRVPSGSLVKVDYGAAAEAPHLPVLAVRIQELYGLKDTPKLARGRLGLLLHLLSPARRPVQITTDLKGFWERTYPEVKKELYQRYPKHFWPDDPASAKATSKTKRWMKG